MQALRDNMDDGALRKEILERLAEMGITSVDGFFSYEGRSKPLRIASNISTIQQLANHEEYSSQLKEEVDRMSDKLSFGVYIRSEN